MESWPGVTMLPFMPSAFTRSSLPPSLITGVSTLFHAPHSLPSLHPHSASHPPPLLPPPHRYVISVARKLGCSVFLVWEDLLQVRGGGALGRTEGEWYGRREEVTPAG